MSSSATCPANCQWIFAHVVTVSVASSSTSSIRLRARGVTGGIVA